MVASKQSISLVCVAFQNAVILQLLRQFKLIRYLKCLYIHFCPNLTRVQIDSVINHCASVVCVWLCSQTESSTLWNVICSSALWEYLLLPDCGVTIKSLFYMD